MFATATLMLAIMGTVSAHIQMQYPPPFNSKFNPNTPSAQIDYDMMSPLHQDGSNFPCKGHQSVLGTAAGAPTASFAVGSRGSVTLIGTANHEGGSCQISLSTDGAKTFRVIKSIIGGCPLSGITEIDFTIPRDAPLGNSVLAWTWFNRIGARELYMNCAAVTLTSPKTSEPSWESRPGIFVANVGSKGGNCVTKEGFDVVYPYPGPDVIEQTEKGMMPGCGITQNPRHHHGFSAEEPDSGFDSTCDAGPEAGTEAAHAHRADDPSTTVVTAIALTTFTAVVPQSDGASRPYQSPAPDSDEGPAEPGSICKPDGLWNCLPGGKTFQRCAAGRWTKVMDTAVGTSCDVGRSLDFHLHPDSH